MARRASLREAARPEETMASTRVTSPRTRASRATSPEGASPTTSRNAGSSSEAISSPNRARDARSARSASASPCTRAVVARASARCAARGVRGGLAVQVGDLLVVVEGEVAQPGTDDGVLGLQEELVEAVGAGEGGVEPHGPRRRLAELRAVGLEHEGGRQAVHRLAGAPADELDPCRDVAPLVAPPHLELAAVVLVEPEEVVGLQQHVAELRVGDALVGTFEASPDGLLGHHLVDGEVLPDVTEELDQRELRQPRPVVEQEAVVEVHEACELGADRLDVGGQDVSAQELALLRLAPGVADHPRASAGERDRPMARELEPPEQRELQQAPDVEAGERRVEPDVEREPVTVEALPQVLVGHLVHQSAEPQVFGQRRHPTSLPYRAAVPLDARRARRGVRHRPMSASASATAASSAAWILTFSRRDGTAARTTVTPSCPAGARNTPSSSATVRTSAVSTPSPAAAPRTPDSWGVAKRRSNSSGPRASACGRNSKMPPPPLSTTMIVQGSAHRVPADDTSAVRSWRKARSPTSATTGPSPAAAAPSAVEHTPSMPLAPRLASTAGGSSRAGANASRSRTGIEEETTRRVLAGTLPNIRRAQRGSFRSASPSTPSMAFCAARSASSHLDSQSGAERGGSMSSAAASHAPGSARCTAATRRPASFYSHHATTATTAAPSKSRGTALEIGDDPRWTTTSGRSAPGARRAMASAAATTWGWRTRHRDRGSASTGHPRCWARASTAPGGPHPAPATRTPLPEGHSQPSTGAPCTRTRCA